MLTRFLKFPTSRFIGAEIKSARMKPTRNMRQTKTKTKTYQRASLRARNRTSSLRILMNSVSSQSRTA